jgi:hypothetical protein
MRCSKSINGFKEIDDAHLSATVDLEYNSLVKYERMGT